MFDLMAVLKAPFTKENGDKIAELLKTSPDALKAFEERYWQRAIDSGYTDGTLLDGDVHNVPHVNAARGLDADTLELLDELVERIVDELCAKTTTLKYLNGSLENVLCLPEYTAPPVSNGLLKKIPVEYRPDLTGTLMRVDISEMSYRALLEMYRQYSTEPDKAKRKLGYDMFRQGLDILDLDDITYQIIDQNRASMGHWFPAIAQAASQGGFFKIPETKIVKVPMPILQLTRLDYELLTPSTLKIVDEWAMRAFGLDVNKSYFVKTGVFSSKFDFRNAKVTGEKEVRELGEYLLFIHNQTVRMASPLATPTIYGAATTVEWVVREFIEDVENNPTIYKGMPLHTEYRAFVDFDARCVFDVIPYWHPDVMKRHFAEGANNSLHDRHDYVVYKAHEEVLMKRFNENKELVRDNIEKLLEAAKDAGLDGQWSIDVMQNGTDFWLIDMGPADRSALSEYINPRLIRPSAENWLPEIK